MRCPVSLAGPNLCPGQIFPNSHLSGTLKDMAATTRTFDKGELPQFHKCKTVFRSCHFTLKSDRNVLQGLPQGLCDLLPHCELPVQLLLQWSMRHSLLNSFGLESQGLIPCPPLSSEFMEVPTCGGILPTSAGGAGCFLQQVHRETCMSKWDTHTVAPPQESTPRQAASLHNW